MSARPCLEGSLPTPQRPAIFHPLPPTQSAMLAKVRCRLPVLGSVLSCFLPGTGGREELA